MLNISYIKHAMFNIFKKPYSSVNKLNKNYRGGIVFKSDKCIDCKKCIEVCTPKSISDFIENTPSGKRVTYKFDMKTCVFCGLCKDFCPKNAIAFSDYSKFINEDKNVFETEGTMLIQDYRANKNEVLSVTQPIKITQIKELLTTLHGQVDIVYQENKKTEEKEARGELIKLLFDENEVGQVQEKPIENEEVVRDDLIKAINVEGIQIKQFQIFQNEEYIEKDVDVDKECVDENLDRPTLEQAVTVNNEELIKELFSEEEESKKTIKDSFFETTANLKDLLKNILVKKDDDGNEDGQVSVLSSEEKYDDKDEIEKEKEENRKLNNVIDMNTTITTVKSRERELLQELFPEKNFDESDSNSDFSVQVIYKKEDLVDSKITQTAIKKDVLPKLFPENYETLDNKDSSSGESEVSISIYTHKQGKTINQVKKINTPKNVKKNYKKSGKKKK